MAVLVNFQSEDGFWARKAMEKVEGSFSEDSKLKDTCEMFQEWLGISVRTLMYSLTGEESQTELRVWTKIPCHLGINHVESFGDGGLISITGRRKEVLKYLSAFLEIYSLSPAILPNGVTVYLAAK